MGGIEHHRIAIVPHQNKGTHVHHQIVVTKGHSTLCKQDIFIAAFFKLVYDILHIPGSHELAFFNVDRFAGASRFRQKIRLSAKKSGDLQNIKHFCRRVDFFLLMDIGQNGNLQIRLDFLQDF